MKLPASRHAVAWSVFSVFLLEPMGAQIPAPAGPAQNPIAVQTAASPLPESVSSWTLHEQATWIDQGHPSFPSPYEGPNSLTGDSQSERTFSFSVFLGYRVWPGTEVYFEPEAFQGHGLSNTLGMAGFPNGEAVKVALERYKAGHADYYELLQVQQELYPAEAALSQTRRDELISIVQLYKALGGGWKLSDAAWLEPKKTS